MSISLNGFKVELSDSTFTAYVQDMPDSKEFRALREKLQPDWFLYWRGGKVYGIKKESQSTQTFGNSIELKCNEHLHLLAAFINSLLPEIFYQYEVFRFRPFTFLAKRNENELVSSIATKIEDLPPLINSFAIKPKFALEAKLVELQHEESFIGLFLRLQTRWQIKASLLELKNAGVNLEGLYVVRRQPQPGQRRLVGKISQLNEKTVYLSESFDEITCINEDEVWLEATKAAFARCLKTLLGSRYEVFESERIQQEANFLTGPALDNILVRMEAFLKRKSPVQITPSLQAHFGSRIDVANNNNYQTVVNASPVEYCFDAARTKRNQYPWNGIERYGPFSRETFSNKSPEI